jgi:hypothetical protein
MVGGKIKLDEPWKAGRDVTEHPWDRDVAEKTKESVAQEVIESGMRKEASFPVVVLIRFRIIIHSTSTESWAGSHIHYGNSTVPIDENSMKAKEAKCRFTELRGLERLGRLAKGCFNILSLSKISLPAA